MLRHVVLCRLKADAPEGALRQIKDGLAHLAESIEEIKNYTYGSDLGLREGNFDLAIVADFENAETFGTYVGHPEHQQFVRECLSPLVAERVALQFEL